MVVREGFDGFSMQKLARAAGVSPTTIYIYFKDK
ncbi:MAG: helix-turn-helix transcriptional regulator [Sphingobacteriales bacterium]|nr:helix-turn-helix transcriptional regulator [Sphingobacteriales bacterium]